MKFSKAKVLHEAFFKPRVYHVTDAVQAAGIDETSIVLEHQQNRALECLQGYNFTPVTQKGVASLPDSPQRGYLIFLENESIN